MHKHYAGWVSGFIGVLIFSMSLPATKVALTGFDPLALTVLRATIAGSVGCAMLLLLRQPLPRQWRGLALVSLGVVIGFPWLTALALQFITAARSTVFVGLLPLSTALFAVLRGGESPRPLFWLFACIGAALVSGFAMLRASEGNAIGDALMVAAILACGLGYAEGAVLSRRLGGWQVISWALVLALPLMLPLAIWQWPPAIANIPTAAWVGLGYVSLFSMLIGFVFWYRGLALGGIASVGQLQLVQPFFSLLWAALLLGEPVSMAMLLTTFGVILCVAGARRNA